MAMTRVSRGLIKDDAPIRWYDTSAVRQALGVSDVEKLDIGYQFLEKDTGTIYVLTAINTDTLEWVGVQGAGLSGGISADMVKTGTGDSGDIYLDTVLNNIDTDLAKKLEKTDIVNAEGSAVSVTPSATDGDNTVTIDVAVASNTAPGVIQIATDEEVTAGTNTTNAVTPAQLALGTTDKLVKDFSSLTAKTDTTITDASYVALYDGSDNGAITAADLKKYITKEIVEANLFLGYFANEEALKNATIDADPVVTPKAGSYAVLESTDSMWIWNSDFKEEGSDTATGQWEDTRIRGTVDMTTQVIAGDGLEGGGTLEQNITLSVKYGEEAATACEGNDPRLAVGAVMWKGTSAELTALESAATVPAINKNALYVVVGGSDEDFVSKIYRLTNVALATVGDDEPAPTTGTPTFELIMTEYKAAATPEVITYEGTLASGVNTITLGAAPSSESFIELYLSGVRQAADAFTISDTTLSLVETLIADVTYTVLVYPLNKAAQAQQPQA